MFQLRNYQETAVKNIIAEWSKGNSTLLLMATGLGKTATAVSTLKTANAKRVLWLVHRDYLIDQSIEAVNKIWPEMGKYATAVQASRNGVNGRFVGATVQTLNNPKRLKELLHHGLFTHLVVDETHRGEFFPDRKRGDVVSKIKRYCPDIKIVGLTATPVKANGEDASWLYDSVAAEYDIQFGVDNGWLAKPVGSKYLLQGNMAKLLPSKSTGDYVDAQLGRIMDTANNAEIVYQKWLEKSANRQTIGFTATIAQAEHLAQLFRKKGIRAFAISGKTKKKHKALIVDSYKKGLIQVIFNCAVLIEGFDAPKTSCILWLRPTLSQALYCQGVGRGLRIVDGKENCQVMNFAPRNGQSLITTEVIYDESKKKEFATERFRRQEDVSVEQEKQADAKKAGLRPVEIKISDVTQDVMDMFVQYRILTGRMVGQTTLKKESYNELKPTAKSEIQIPQPKRNTVWGKLKSLLN